MGRLWRKLGCFATESSAPVVDLKTHGPPLAEIGLLGSGIKCACDRSKDPWSTFGGNWAAWQRNQVRLWRN